MKRLSFLALALAAALPLQAAAPRPAPYPLKTCIVTDNKLGSMGDERSFTHEGRVIKVCCKPCIAKFKKNPAKYLAKLR